MDKIEAAIVSFVRSKENEVSETMDIPPSQHRLLIGTGGETRRAIEAEYSIRLDIPKQSVQGAARSAVKLSGPLEKVARAKDHIAKLVQGQQGQTVQVPRNLHHVVSNNGQFFRHLRNTHNVTVDHGGQQPPARRTGGGAAAAAAAQRSSTVAAPLITDDASTTAPDAHSWVVHEHGADEDDSEDGTIPWILKSPSEASLAQAVAQLEAALRAAQQHSATGYLILPDPRTYRFVIGPGGAQINAIRDATGCKVTVPKNRGAEAIEVSGSLAGVEKAREMILEAVRNGR